MFYITLVLAIAISIRILCWASEKSSKRCMWSGNKLVYTSMITGISFIFTGSWALVLSNIFSWLTYPSGVMLLIGIDLLILVNKRSPFRRQ